MWNFKLRNYWICLESKVPKKTGENHTIKSPNHTCLVRLSEIYGKNVMISLRFSNTSLKTIAGSVGLILTIYLLIKEDDTGDKKVKKIKKTGIKEVYVHKD